MKISPNNLKIFENLPPEVLKIFTIFNGNIRLVGGSVRDLILEKNLDFKYPNLGVGAINFHKILKKRLKKNVNEGMFLKYSDIK